MALYVGFYSRIHEFVCNHAWMYACDYVCTHVLIPVYVHTHASMLHIKHKNTYAVPVQISVFLSHAQMPTFCR